LRVYIAGLFILCLVSCLPFVSREDLPREGPIIFREREIREPVGDDSSRESLLLSLEKSLVYLCLTSSIFALPHPVAERV